MFSLILPVEEDERKNATWTKMLKISRMFLEKSTFLTMGYTCLNAC